MTDKLTLDDVRQMFGGTIPKSALNIISVANDNVTLDDLRHTLEGLAALEHAAPRKRSLGVLFGKELNDEHADGQG
ncbi:hypothetical protein E4191_08075 [Paracoccus liaowanqingii]|uniref:Uncharacterized protein n=1 Tax=Paracoccus liaowanqingii TaxID=2560053 RepID=A0A4P7HLW1_9RHOB|nr:hypothetical protein [Paracoccus liaowanqingii]QBX34670.1 hypothetical protein E4191_08075 [Paracoccus liaowanqingii]